MRLQDWPFGREHPEWNGAACALTLVVTVTVATLGGLFVAHHFHLF